MSDFRDIIGENFSPRQTPRTKIGEIFSAKILICDIGENFRALQNIWREICGIPEKYRVEKSA